MNRFITRTISLAVLATTLYLAAPATTHAQDAQQNETDLQFIKRMTTKLQRTESEAERLENFLREMSGPTSQYQMTGQDQYGRPSSSMDRQSEYRRAGSRMRSTRKKAEKEREKLVEIQRLGGNIDASDRKRIESTVARLERAVADAERDIRMGRF